MTAVTGSRAAAQAARSSPAPLAPDAAEDRLPARGGLHLTGAGAGVLGGSIVLGVMAWAFGFPELMIVAAAGIVALLLALLAVLVPIGVQIERRFRPDRVAVDGPAASLLTVTNRGRLPVPGMRAVDRVGPRTLEVAVPWVPAAGNAVVRMLLPTGQRGRFGLGPVRVQRTDPLGLMTRWRSRGATGVLWVRPRVHSAKPLSAGVVLDLEGPLSDTATEGTLTFSSLREYVPGDDLRRIHWPTTARIGSLMVRTHIDTSQPRATVVFDTRDAVWTSDSFEHGVEVVASVAESFRQVGHSVNLRLLGERPRDVRSLGARDDLDRLAIIAPSDTRNPAGLAGLIERVEGGGVLVVVTGQAEAGLLTRVATQRRRFAPVLLLRVIPEARTVAARRAGVLDISARDAVGCITAWNQEAGR